jgi:DNA-binding XRE family transcriptional regulator
MMTLGARVRKYREALGLSQADLGEAVGMSQQAIGAIESGRVVRPKKLREIARALKSTEEALLGEVAESRYSHAGVVTSPTDALVGGDKVARIGRNTYSGLGKVLPMNDASTPVIGKVAAGVWLEADPMGRHDPIDYLPIPGDSRYPAGTVFGLEVEGSSLNLIAKPGDVLVCASIYSGIAEVNENDLVIVQRTRFGGLLHEVTAKRVRRADGKFLLVPESTDPAWQTPIEVPVGEDGETEIAVIAKVLWIFKKP